MLKLHDHVLSAESYTVRLMLALLELPYERIAVDAYPGAADCPVLFDGEDAQRDPGLDEGATTVAYVPHKGWFWYIPMHSNIVSVGIVAEPGYLYRDTRDPEAIYQREIDSCVWIRDHVKVGTRCEPVKVTGEYSYHSSRIGGESEAQPKPTGTRLNAAINRAMLRLLDPRDGNVEDRLAVLDAETGVWRCHAQFNCVAACPKGIDVFFDNTGGETADIVVRQLPLFDARQRGSILRPVPAECRRSAAAAVSAFSARSASIQGDSGCSTLALPLRAELPTRSAS